MLVLDYIRLKSFGSANHIAQIEKSEHIVSYSLRAESNKKRVARGKTSEIYKAEISRVVDVAQFSGV